MKKNRNKVMIYYKTRLKHKAALQRLALSVLEGEGRKGYLINIVFCGSDKISEMNLKYRKKKGDTDVITFENEEPIGGDIYISAGRAKADAAELGISIEHEISRLVVHGCLHVCGYTHKLKDKRKLMRAREEKYLNIKGYGTLIS